MNVVLCSDLYLPGTSGLITSVRNIAEALACAGHHVTLIGPYSDAARRWADRNAVSLAAVCGITIPAKIQQRAAVSAIGYRNLITATLRGADVIHLHSPIWLGLAVARLARQHRVPIVVTNHLLPENLSAALRIPLPIFPEPLPSILWKRIQKGVRIADIVTTPSNYGAEILRSRLGITARVISNGVKRRCSTVSPSGIGTKNEPMRAVYVGRLQREKRVDELISIVAAAKRSQSPIHLTVVGGGPDKARLTRIAKKLKILPYVNFAGILSDELRDYHITNAHFLLMASRSELQCCAALEAMAAGRPVVAARAGALPETVPDGVAGSLYTPGDVNDAVSKLTTISADTTLYDRLSRGARENANQHEMPHVYNELISIYASISKGKSSSTFSWRAH